MAQYEQIAKEKQAARDALIPSEWKLQQLPSPSTLNVTSIPRECGILTDNELRITEDYDATSLAEAMATRKLTSLEVTTAYCKRAAIAQQLTNCLTEINFDQALVRAKQLDHHLSRYGAPVGPLHGVPVSLKDAFRIAKLDATIGYAAHAFQPSTFNSPLVNILIEAGAVLYCKTNVPQTLMALDSVNNVWGRTLNPHNRHVTAGGSSGGEGALLAMKGSPLGVGTDIGGSIRIPSFCNGLYGIMPSADRVPYQGLQESSLPGGSALSMKSRAGPMARSLRDCELFLRTVAASQPWLRDPNIIPGFWEHHMDLRRSGARTQPPTDLTFGILTTDLTTPPLPPIRRLLDTVSTSLQSAGHHSTTLTTPPLFRKLQSLSNALLSITGSERPFATMHQTAEPLIPWLNGRMRPRAPRTVTEAADIQRQVEETRTELLKQLWSVAGREIDAIVCPVAPHPVPRTDRWGTVGYTIDWVTLDCCAGVVPVRFFDEGDMQGEVEGAAVSAADEANRRLWEEREREVYLGTPLGVQVVAPRLQERRLYRAMEAVDSAVRGMRRDEVVAGTMGGMAGAKL